MNTSIYEWTFIIMNFFGAYTVYKFMNIFFDRKKLRNKIELLSYIAYSIFIAAIYLIINIPVIVMICNIVAFMVLSLNYKSNIKKRIVSIALIYLILMCVEMIVALISGYFNFPLLSANDYSSVYGLIIVKILSYVVALIFSNYKNIKSGGFIPNSNWFCIVLMPMASLYIILTLFQASNLSWIQVMVGIVFMLLINFATFHLYDVIIEALSDKMEKMLLEQKNKYYENQFNLMKLSLESARTIKHDLKNHLSALYSLVQNEEKQKSLKHISDMIRICGQQKEYACSGNVAIDSILNFKLQEAEQKKIKTTLDINVPEELNVQSFDMTIILGNLLDNAITAVCKLAEQRYINIIIKYDKGRFVLHINNPFEGEIVKEGNALFTTKSGKSNHGIGLQSIKAVLEKYNGSIEIEHSKKVFSVTLLMYIALFESNC